MKTAAQQIFADKLAANVNIGHKEATNHNLFTRLLLIITDAQCFATIFVTRLAPLS